MSFALLTRMMRTASFGLAVLYTLLFVASVLILGVVFYLIVQTSLDRQIASRIDAEIALLDQELKFEGKDALVREVEERTKRLARARLSRARCQTAVGLPAICPQCQTWWVGPT